MLGERAMNSYEASVTALKGIGSVTTNGKLMMTLETCGCDSSIIT